ncbi:hypothetical protein FQN57_001600 [Myotisia sp. PD_48]|nr:hypothetical protein FQN57_001600 [Myotisia sp. PD_48]
MAGPPQAPILPVSAQVVESELISVHRSTTFSRPTDSVLLNFGRKSLQARGKVYVTQSVRPVLIQDRYATLLHEIRQIFQSQSDSRNGLRRAIYSRFHKPTLPSVPQLLDLAKHYFPPRGNLKVQICDIYKNRATLEDLFRDANEKGRRPFEVAGDPGWTYIETQCLNFRHREEVRDLRDAYCMLSEIGVLATTLNDCCIDGGMSNLIRDDLAWRASHFGTQVDFWEQVASDVPWQLADGKPANTKGPLGRIRPNALSRDFEIHSAHENFQNAQLVRNPFRTFNGNNGMLLTMSAAKGVNYLDSRLGEYICNPPDSILTDSNASAIGYVMKEFESSGTSAHGQWHRATTEWFLVHLITEIGVTPHNHRNGHNMLSLADIYEDILLDFKLQTYQPWKPDRTVELTRRHLQCIEEVQVICDIQTKKCAFFNRLKIDCENFECEDKERGIPPHNPDGKTSVDRVQWAVDMVEEQLRDYTRLLGELNRSLENLVNMRSIEQNELAIRRDSQDQAVFIFTGVTVVFLPLSFCASYFGMNLTGVVNTARSESYFWAVCGTSGFSIVLVMILHAFRHKYTPYLADKIAR